MERTPITLVIQSFGRENEYKRAILTILSFYNYVSGGLENNRVLLFTDKPEYFKEYLKELPVTFVLLTADKIAKMRGEIDFLHRMKIAVIEESFECSTGCLIYADSDTFFTADPSAFCARVTPENAFMHVWEYHFSEMKAWPLPAGETFQAFYRLITSQKIYLANGTEIPISPQDSSWNAGVMIFHPEHARYIPDVYALTNQFYPPSLNHASEQYAFSVILSRFTKLAACDSVIYHYWYKIKKQIIDDFLMSKFNSAWAERPLLEKLQFVANYVEQMPAYFDEHIWTVRDKAIQAFNANDFRSGYKYSAKAFLRNPWDKQFAKDVFYHVKRHLKK